MSLKQGRAGSCMLERHPVMALRHLVMAPKHLVIASEVLKRLLGPVPVPSSSVRTSHHSWEETTHLVPACLTPAKGIKLRESLSLTKLGQQLLYIVYVKKGKQTTAQLPGPLMPSQGWDCGPRSAQKAQSRGEAAPRPSSPQPCRPPAFP